MNPKENWKVEKILSEVDIRDNLISKEQLTVMREYENAGGVAVWGTGRAGSYAVDFCQKNGIQLTCVVDSFDHQPGSTFKGLQLLSASDFFHQYPNTLVLIACSFGYMIDKLLEEKGYLYLVFDTNFLDLKTLEDSYQDILLQNKDNIEDLYALLSDNTSRYVLEQVLKYRLSLNRQHLDGLNTQQTYFGNDVISTFSGISFVDCGAFSGDTLLMFHRTAGCRCQTYYALEPSQDNFEQLESTIQTHKIKNVIPLKIGAWDKTDVLHFADQHGGASNISEIGETSIHVDSLDHLFYDKNVDFIKMDIEGAEKQAILGAKDIIQQRTPYLAFSIYHRAQDLWQLPLLVNELNKNYRFYIRHHSAWGDDTVCYAVPQKG